MGFRMQKKNMLLSIELNELNFDYLKKYVEIGKLPHFAKLFSQHSIRQTTSESEYKHLEPWIQWVTAHTGKTFAEHGVFRLGDINQTSHEQIWEHLERKGISVGAVSPMNAENRIAGSTFFVPDPWTQTQVTGGWVLKKMYEAISQAVSDNATSKISPRSLFFLLLGAASYASPSNYLRYLRLVLASKGKKWNQALFLDLLLSDCFLKLQRKHSTQYATLFLNAGAHVQHHYMFSSAFSVSPHRNPSWYVAEGIDPVFEVYYLYDHILGRIQKAFPEARLLLMTGLHQTAYPRISYYWRLKNHETFLRSLGVKFQSVIPLMSRDFIVKCAGQDEANTLAQELGAIRALNGEKIFTCDKRTDDVFVELTYDQEIAQGFEFIHGNKTNNTLKDNVAFVAIKNGEHSGEGYFLDTRESKNTQPNSIFPLKDVFNIVREAFSV
jgi:hypothetical protein